VRGVGAWCGCVVWVRGVSAWCGCVVQGVVRAWCVRGAGAWCGCVGCVMHGACVMVHV
jgi:hypothetical protein